MLKYLLRQVITCEVIQLKFFESFLGSRQQDEFLNEFTQKLDENDIVSVIDNRSVVFTDCKNINYVTHDGKNVEVHLCDESVITSSVVKFEFYDKLLKKCFKQMDRNTYVNFDNIMWYDLEYYRVYFSDKDYVQVAGTALRKLKMQLGKEKDIRNASMYCFNELRPIVSKRI